MTKIHIRKITSIAEIIDPIHLVGKKIKPAHLTSLILLLKHMSSDFASFKAICSYSCWSPATKLSRWSKKITTLGVCSIAICRIHVMFICTMGLTGPSPSYATNMGKFLYVAAERQNNTQSLHHNLSNHFIENCRYSIV